jgi:predicted phage terminase large subunit-like protein
MASNIPADLVELWWRLEQLDGRDSILANMQLLTASIRGVPTQRPAHLVAIADALYRGETEGNVRLCVSVPPRHGKTELLKHFVPWYLKRHPDKTVAYLMHTQRLAERKSGEIRDLVKRAGLNIRKDSKSKSAWQLTEGGGLDAMGTGASPTGLGFNWIIVDDPIKSREDAESATMRDKVFEWMKADVFTRLEPGGNIVVCHTRWHADDPIGRLTGEDDPEAGGGRWEYVNLPAIHEEPDPVTGEMVKVALWPEQWPVDLLEERKREVGPYNWASMYQGEPRPRGGRLFGEPARYVAADLQGARIAIACDPAATDKTTADHSVIVVMAAKGIGLEQKAYVLEVWRGQVQIPELVQQLVIMQRKWQCPVHIEAIAGFKAVPQMLHRIDPSLKIVEISGAIGDKFTRSQPCAAAWSDGRVLVPITPQPWLGAFLKEVQAFTGVKDAHDDQVDAMAHAYNAINRLAPPVKRGPQAYRT